MTHASPAVRGRPPCWFPGVLMGAVLAALPVAGQAADPPGLYLRWSALKERILPPPPSLRESLPQGRATGDGGLAFSLTLDRSGAPRVPGEPAGATTFRDRSTAERWYPETVFFLGVHRRF